MSQRTPDISEITSTYGVFPGPFGNVVRTYGINNSNPHALFSPQGQLALHSVLQEQAPHTTVGSAPTFRATNLRAGDGRNDQWDVSNKPKFDPMMGEYNKLAVRIARAAHGSKKRIVGLLAPLSDTSGGDDSKWQTLTNAQKLEWARRRHAPQVEALYLAGIRYFQLEAGRYVPEAIALAQVVDEVGGEGLAFCFEAPDGRVPDPENQNLRFKNVCEQMQEITRGRIITQVGINCVGVSAVQKALDSGESLDIVYPNTLDFGKDQSGKLREEFVALSEKKDSSPIDQVRLATITETLTTTPKEFAELWKICLQARVQAISTCCGGTTTLVELAKKVWDQNVL